MSRLEEEVQAARAEKASVLADLASVRELCVKLDSSKELTVRQLTAKSMELERVKTHTSSYYVFKKVWKSANMQVTNTNLWMSTSGDGWTGGCVLRGRASEKAAGQRAADGTQSRDTALHQSTEGVSDAPECQWERVWSQSAEGPPDSCWQQNVSEKTVGNRAV